MIYGLDKLTGVHPRLWAAMGLLAVRSKYDWKIVSGKRTNQAELYAQGRTAPGNIVTDAPPGSSAHEFGLGIDAQPTLDKGKTVVQDMTHPAYNEKDAIFAGNPLGVRTGIVISSGPDRPHFEVENWKEHKDWLTVYAGISLALVGLVVIFKS